MEHVLADKEISLTRIDLPIKWTKMCKVFVPRLDLEGKHSCSETDNDKGHVLGDKVRKFLIPRGVERHMVVAHANKLTFQVMFTRQLSPQKCFVSVNCHCLEFNLRLARCSAQAMFYLQV